MDFREVRMICWRTIAEFFGFTEPTSALTGGTDNTFLRADGTWAGTFHSLSTNYISGTGTAGADGTAQTVVTVAVAADTLAQVGDRLHIKAFWRGDTGGAVTGALALNTVSVATTTDGGEATMQFDEVWLQYVDATHANIISMTAGALNTTLSNNNVAGFNWAASQDLIITQDNVANNHIIVYSVIVEVYPKGTA